MDLADVIEETRKLKRRLVTSYGLTTSEIFDPPFIDHDHMVALRRRLLEITTHSGGPREDDLQIIDKIIEALAGNPPRPAEEALCKRFVVGELDARTVIHITGWTVDELYDACEKHGFGSPSGWT